MRALTAWLVERHTEFGTLEAYFDGYSIAGDRLAGAAGAGRHPDGAGRSGDPVRRASTRWRLPATRTWKSRPGAGIAASWRTAAAGWLRRALGRPAAAMTRPRYGRATAAGRAPARPLQSAGLSARSDRPCKTRSILDALRRGAAAEAAGRRAQRRGRRSRRTPQAHRLLALSLQLQGEADAGAGQPSTRPSRWRPDDADLHLQRAGLLLAAAPVRRGAGRRWPARSASTPTSSPPTSMQAQLALGRGDLDEAERLRPHRHAHRARRTRNWPRIEGMLALRRGDADRALASCCRRAAARAGRSAAAPRARLRLPGQGHLAFAEQAFRRVLEADPGVTPAARADRRAGRAARAARPRPPTSCAAAGRCRRRHAGAAPPGRRAGTGGRPAAQRAAAAAARALSPQPDDRHTLQPL